MFFFLGDVDECAENNTLCGSLQCVNLPGSFQCLGKCDVGFKRTMDDKECVGKMYVREKNDIVLEIQIPLNDHSKGSTSQLVIKKR